MSGGADSVCLLHLLVELAPRWSLALSVVHIDHGIRGEASRADAFFVRGLADAQSLPFHLLEARVPEIDGNQEQAARRVRQSFYQQLLSHSVVDGIATAHTRSDQAETVLYRVLRGAGLQGLSGIRPLTTEGLVRPLIDIGRDEIEAWMRERNLTWREDETNRDVAYARNRLRHQFLPALRESFNPRLEETLAHMAVLAQDEEEFWRSEILTRDAAFSMREGEPMGILEVESLVDQPPAVARRRIRQALEAVRGDLRQIDFAHVEAVLEMARSPQGHGRMQLPGLDIFRSFEWIRIAPAGYDSMLERNFHFPLTVPGSVTLPRGAGSVTIERIEGAAVRDGYDTVEDELDWQCLTTLSPREVAELAGASGWLELRNWRPGDQYRPAGQSELQRLKLLFQTERIPLWDRRNWPIITCGGRIVWARRFGPAAEFARAPETRMVLRIRDTVPRAGVQRSNAG